MSIRETTPEQARALLQDEGWTYLDVRTVEEFEAGHVPGAYNIPIFFAGSYGMQPNADFVEAVKRTFQATERLVVGCKAGGRSRRACELLAHAGFGELVNMDGGFHGRPDETGRIVQQGWQASGFEVAREPHPGRSWSEIGG